MKALAQLGTAFRPVAKLGAAAALAASPIVGATATAQEAKTYPAAASASTVQFYEDADFESSKWVVDRPDRVAVSVRLGGGTEFSPDIIQQVLDKDLRDANISNAVFFWEHGSESGGTSVVVETDQQVFGPYGLGEVRREVPKIASQILFNRQIDLAELSNSNQP